MAFPVMGSSIVIVILVFAILGILTGFSEAVDNGSEKIAPKETGALMSYTPPTIYPSVQSMP